MLLFFPGNYGRLRNNMAPTPLIQRTRCQFRQGTDDGERFG